MTHDHTPESFRTDVLDVARAEYERNVREDKGTNDDKAGRIALYRDAVRDSRYTMKVGDAYCAAFVSFILEQAGRPIRHEHGEGLSYVPWLLAEAKKRDAFYTDEMVLFDQLGDLVIFNTGSRPNHVGFVEAFGEDYSVQTIEGNVGGHPNGGVKVRSHSLKSEQIVGYVDVWELTRG